MRSIVTGLVIASMFALAGLADVRPVVIGDQVEFPKAGIGAPRSFVQLVWDNQKGRLDRREVTVFDPFAAQNLALSWEPRFVATLKGDAAEGEGILTWRTPGEPEFLQTSVIAQYSGEMQNGRPEGQGVFLARTGARYDGSWRNGVMHGDGVLRAADGASYRGEFRDGQFEGKGLIIAATGAVFDGTFAGGQREGPGRVLMPDGTRFSSVWQAGEEISAERRALSGAWADVFPAQAVPAPRGLAIPINVGGPIEFCCGIGPSKLRYTSSSLSDRVEIYPDLPDLLEIWRGQRNVVIENPAAFDWDRAGFASYTFLNLTELQNAFEVPLLFGLENRQQHPVVVVGGYLEFARSKVDQQPAIQSLILKPMSNQNIEFSIENYGWSAARDARLDFQFTDGARFGPRQQIGIGTIDGISQFSFGPALEQLGVDVNSLRATGGKCPQYGEDSCLANMVQNGVFGEVAGLLQREPFYGEDGPLILSATGELSYRWTDADGAGQQTTAPFDASIPLMTFLSRAECEGGEIRDIADGRVFEMRESESNYRIPFNLQTQVHPGETQRWQIELEAAKSTFHQLRVVLVLADGREIASRDIQIEYLRPRSFPESVRPFEPRC